MRKIKYFRLRTLSLALVASFILWPLPSQPVTAKDKGQLREVVFVHHKLPPELDFAKGGGRPLAQCTVTTNDESTTWGATGWHMPASGLTYQVSIATLPSNITGASFLAAFGRATATWESQDASINWTDGGTTSVRRSRLDGVNLVSFGNTSGAIAVTRTWYWTGTGEVAESDLTFASNLAWSMSSPTAGDCSGTAKAYDVQNIATHELGHQVGLDDLYASTDKDLTMYGYGTTAELKKDSLGAGDIAGAKTVTP